MKVEVTKKKQNMSLVCVWRGNLIIIIITLNNNCIY